VASDALDSGFRHILDAITDGVYVTSADREIVFWSAGAERITGYSSDEAVGSHCYDDLLVPTDLRGRQLCLSGCPLQECISTGQERAVNEVFLRRSDGERIAVYVRTTVLQVDDQRYGVEIFGALETVAGKQLTAQAQQLSDSAVTDALTGLFNRRYLDAALSQQFEMFRRLGRKYGVIRLDLDGFKTVNERLGHAVGDEALRFVATILSDNVRKMDVVARHGGDEFVVVCSLATPDDLAGYGRRLVRLIHDSRFAPAEDAGLRVTASGGGSLVALDDVDERRALARADQAMYAAKHSGRDGFSVTDGEKRG